MKTLYALLAAINEYQYITSLDAAVYDMERVKTYLQKFAGPAFQIKLKTLENSQATKSGIVSAFEEQLIQTRPKKGDVVFFYYSGHGGLEEADPVFWKSAFNKRLENIACHDGNLSNGKGFLADKELRWLISRAAAGGAHVVTIFDCCHAGDNPRGYKTDDIPKAKKRLAGVSKQRDWNDFIFAGELKKEALAGTSLDAALPQGKHVSIAACESHESAFEIIDGGIFTTGLLQTLEKSKGDISYFELKNRVKNFVKGYYQQTPQIYAAGGEDPKELFKSFLGGAVKDKPMYGNIYYNYQERRWELDLGAIYGVTTHWKGEPQQITVTLPSKEQVFAYVMEVHPEKAVVEFEPYSDVKKGEQYLAYVPSLMLRQLNIFLKGEAEGIKNFKAAVTAEKLEKAGLRICEDESEADFCLLAKNNYYLITLPNDDKPLTAQNKNYTAESAESVIEKLAIIGRWSFVKKLQNEKTTLPPAAIKVDFFENNQPLNIVNDQVHIYFKNAAEAKTQITVRLTNTTDRALYASLIYGSSLFGLSPNLLQGQVQRLDPHSETWARAGSPITLKLESYIRDFKWSEEVFYLQLIVSTNEFTSQLFEQKELDAPRLVRGGAKKKGLDEEELAPIAEVDWRTKLMTIHLKNPDLG